MLHFLIYLLLSVPSFANNLGNQSCSRLMSLLIDAASWRSATTHANSLNIFSKTSPAREQQIKDILKEMHTDYVGPHTDTPMMYFVASDGVTVKRLAKATGLDTDSTIEKIQVGNLGPTGELAGTLMLPVSGHTGMANANKWAKTDLYTVRVKDKTGAEAPIAHAKSLDLVTEHEVNFTLKKNEPVDMLYYRHGSGGPPGYPQGRTITVIWDGT